MFIPKSVDHNLLFCVTQSSSLISAPAFADHSHERFHAFAQEAKYKSLNEEEEKKKKLNMSKLSKYQKAIYWSNLISLY